MPSGGAVNVITRSGTNQFHGRAFYYGQDGEWNSKNFFALNHAQADNTTKLYGATLGGPIVRDKTHYFASVERMASGQPHHAPRSHGGTVHEPDSPFRGWGVFGKVTHQLNDKHTLLSSPTCSTRT